MYFYMSTLTGVSMGSGSRSGEGLISLDFGEIGDRDEAFASTQFRHHVAHLLSRSRASSEKLVDVLDADIEIIDLDLLHHHDTHHLSIDTFTLLQGCYTSQYETK